MDPRCPVIGGDRALGDPERVVVRGGTLAFWRRGHGGVPLLLVHGWPSTRRIWARNVVDLAARGFDPDTVGAMPAERVHDQPGGATG